jgi:hypothetical protein
MEDLYFERSKSALQKRQPGGSFQSFTSFVTLYLMYLLVASQIY